MKKSFVCGCALALAGLACGGALDTAVLHGETDKARAIDYAPGEEMVFTLKLLGAESLPEKPHFIFWTRTGDDGKAQSGKVPLSLTEPLVIRTSLDRPGFVRVRAFVGDEKGAKYKKAYTGDTTTPEGRQAMNAYERTDRRVFFDGSAGVKVETLQSVPEPADFDDFWAKRKARLAKVPLKPVLKEQSSVNPAVRCYTFSVPCAGPRPATGVLTIPSDKSKTYPAVIQFHGYGAHYVQVPAHHGPTDRIRLQFNAHGYELEREPEYYDEFYNSIKSNGQSFAMDSDWQNKSTDTAYFGWMIYRILRALELIESLPEWNGMDLTAEGGSMGGLQTIWAAALDSHVSEAKAGMPWCCDMGGRTTLKRDKPDWGVGETEALRYFDPVNLARRIGPNCRVEITKAGLGDYTCPPSGVAILYNNMKCPKKINWMQGETHGYVPTEAGVQKFVLSQDWLPEAKHDCGGVSFDFKAISERNNAGMFDGENLLTNVWKGTHVENVPCPQVVKLPDAEGGWYRVSCRTKVRSTNAMDSAVMVRLGTANPEFADNPARRGRWVWCPFAKRDDAYFPATTRFEVRPGETHAHVSLWNRRQFVDIRDLTLFREKPAADAAPLSIGVQITDFLDGRFVLAAGQTVAMAFNIVPRQPGSWNARKLDVRFELPNGVRLVDMTRGFQIAGFSHWNSTYALLEATGPVGVAGTGRIVATYDDGRRKFDFSSKPIRFEIMPTIRVPVPKHYRNGAFTVRSFDFRQLSSCDRYAASLADYGCRWVLPGMATSYPALAAWRKYGLWVTPYSNNCSNGYKIGDRNVPPDVQYVVAGTNPHVRSIPPPNDRICPLAVIDRSEYYRTKVEPLLARTLAGTDGMWSNWEPYMFEGVGCCCDRCRRAFAAHVGKSEAEIAAGWPTNVLRGGVWAKEAVRFRSICHGKLVKTIAESVRKATDDGPVGFMPAVHFEQLMENWRTQLPLPEAQEIDYAGSLKWIQPWGPYVPWFTDKLYCRERGKYVNHCLVAPAVRRGVERDYPLPNRPKLLAGPQGVCDGWLTQPENFKMAFDAYFFNRYGGCAPWMFPVGADARFWRAFADATALAAKYEDIVRTGTDASANTGAETVPEYAATIRMPTRRIPTARDVSHLFVFAYEKESKRIAAVFNCWQDGEAFFTLRAADLKPGAYEIVSDDGVAWTKGKGSDTEPWSAAELAKGVFLSVGAARTRVFEIRPVGSTDPTAATSYRSSDRVRAAYESRRAVLAEAAARDAAEAKAHTGVPTRDD